MVATSMLGWLFNDSTLTAAVEVTYSTMDRYYGVTAGRNARKDVVAKAGVKGLKGAVDASLTDTYL